MDDHSMEGGGSGNHTDQMKKGYNDPQGHSHSDLMMSEILMKENLIFRDGGDNYNNDNNYSEFSTTLGGIGSIIMGGVGSGGNSSGNWSGDLIATDTYVPYSLRPETYIIPVLFAIIFIIGVLGNGTLIAIFLKHRSMRNVPNTPVIECTQQNVLKLIRSIWTSLGGRYIVSLAVGDLLVILFCVPFTSTVYTVESWPYGLIVCKFSEFIKDVSIGVSVFTLTALSADRYFAIVDPMRKLHGVRASKITCISITGIWIVSIVFALPSIMHSFIWTIEDASNNHTYDVCYPFPDELGPTYPKVVVMFKFLVYYAIPLAFIATFYIIMAHHLLLSTRNMPGEAPGQAKQIQSRKKVAKMVMAFVVIFALCFFPSHVFLIWFYYNPNSQENYNDFWHVVRMLGFCLSFINSCLNPITLYCVSGTFRKHFNRHLFCCCCPNDVRSRSIRGGYSMTHTEHMYHDRMSTRNGTQISRASTIVGGGGGGHHNHLQQIRRPTHHQWGNNGDESHLNPQQKFGGSAGQRLLPPGCTRDLKGLKNTLDAPNTNEHYQLNHLNSSGISKDKRGSMGEALTVGM